MSTAPLIVAIRQKLPTDRLSVTHRFVVGGCEGYITVGLFPDGRPGEIFIHVAKEGSTLSGFMESFAIMTSMALQYGVPLEVICEKFSHVAFEPDGWSQHTEIGYASSLVDYLFRWMAFRFLGKKSAKVAPVLKKEDVKQLIGTQDGPACQGCGSIMTRNGTCYGCRNCGSTSGCS